MKIYTAENTKLFNYTGSKAKYREKFNDLHSQINIKEVHTYIEAFCGSLASVFHNLTQVNAQRVIINDINPRLINLYKQIKTNPQEVIEVFTLLETTFQSYIPKEFEGKKLIRDKKLREKKLSHLRDFYNSARDYYNTSDFKSSKNAGTLLFLLQHNFRGCYNEAQNGTYNISFNWNVRKIDIDKIISHLTNLHNFFVERSVIIENMDVNLLIEKYSKVKNTLIYLDPPYLESVVRYSAEQTTNFSTERAHLELLKSCQVFDYILYSNNINETINKQFQYIIQFSRTNTIARTKQSNHSKSKVEILGFIDNSIIAMPSVAELLDPLITIKPKTMPKIKYILETINTPLNNTLSYPLLKKTS